MTNRIKPKLLVTASTFPRWKDDSEPRFVLDLAKAMQDDFDITVLVPSVAGAKKKEILEGVSVIRYRYFPIKRWETLCYPGAIVPRIKEKKIRILLVPFLFISLFVHLCFLLPKFDFVHAHWIIPQGIIQSFFKKPYIVTGHGGDVTSLNNRILKTLKKKCLKNAKQVTVVSNFLKEEVQKIAPQINPYVISMGVNTDEFGKQYRVPDYFGQGNKKVILYVGRLVEKKGVTYLIEAMNNIDALLVIVGKGPLENELKIQANKISGKVKFWGSKNHEELKNIYASADIFVAPSIRAKDGDMEGLGLVILEAMASGIPVVASNSGGIKELIEDNINGFLVEEKNVKMLADKIKVLLEDDYLYRKIVENTEIVLEQYSYKRLGNDYIKIIK